MAFKLLEIQTLFNVSISIKWISMNLIEHEKPSEQILNFQSVQMGIFRLHQGAEDCIDFKYN